MIDSTIQYGMYSTEMYCTVRYYQSYSIGIIGTLILRTYTPTTYKILNFEFFEPPRTKTTTTTNLKLLMPDDTAPQTATKQTKTASNIHHPASNIQHRRSKGGMTHDIQVLNIHPQLI